MTAVFTSSGLGLFNSSADTLGQAGLLGNAGHGQSGEQVFVNAATGNLLIRRIDEVLVGQGIDTTMTRTYNSLGGMTDSNGDDWVVSPARYLTFTGTRNTVGSTVTRHGPDGSVTVFQYDASAGRYFTTDGAGAHDTVEYDTSINRWKWMADGGALHEEYNNSHGRIVRAEDRDGNLTRYNYTSNGDIRRIRLTDATGAVQRLMFDYNGSGLLEATRIISDGSTTRLTTYTYDASDRLSTVRVDLTPESSSDSSFFTTTYTYDGSSTRISTLTQTDGTSLTFGYILSGSDYRVASVTNAAGEVTSYDYTGSDANGAYTEIQAPTGATTKVYADAAGRLVRLEAPAVDGQRTTLVYAYDADGNLTSVTDNAANQTLYTYDANGNRLSSQDSLGNRTEWTYTATDQVATSTAFISPDPDGAGVLTASDPLTTRWIYDAEGHVTHMIDAAGGVSRFTYNAVGDQTAQQVFRSGAYDVSALGTGTVPTAAAVDAWIATQDLANSQRTDFSYDFRGQLESMTEWASVDAAGAGVAGTDAITRYVYDHTGKLLKQVTARGEATVEEDYVNVFTYDGLSRITSTTAEEGQSVTTTYADTATGTTATATTSAGLVTVSTFDASGRLVSVNRSDGGSGDFGETQFTYQDGFLRSTLSTAGGRSYSFYDNAGRLQYTVDETGAVSEIVYDSLGRVDSTTSFANAVDTTTWYDSVNDVVSITTATFEASFKPTANLLLDRSTSNTYDNAGRLTASTDGTLETTYLYDGLGRLTDQSSAALGGGGLTRTTNFYYDDASRQVAVIDAEGALTENRYDAAGRLIEQVAYADRVAASDRSLAISAILSGLTPDADDQSTHYYYDDRGRLIGTVDAELYLTAYGYDVDGNRTSVTRFATVLTGVALATDVLPTIAASADDQSSTLAYDQSGRLLQTTNHQGNIEAYTYDDHGNVVRINQYSTTPGGEVRRSFLRYDEAGRLTGELSAEQASALTDLATQTQIDAAIATNGIQRIYDPAGRLLQMTDQVGNDAWFFYDDRGQVRYTINALGEVLETEYNSFGDVSSRTAYANRVSVSGLTGGTVTPTITALVTAAADAANDRVTEFEFDERGLLARQISRVLNPQDVVQDLVTDYSYTVWGQLDQSVSDASYDGLTRTSNSYTYDLMGRELTATIAVGADSRTQTVEYDAFGRVIKQWDALNRLSEFGYDKNGRLIDVTDPLNRTQQTIYDAFGRTLTVTDALQRSTVFDYDDAAREMTVTLPGGITTISRQNEFGETIEVVDANLVSTFFDYDQNGNLVTTTINVDGQDQTISNDYDAANRLFRTTDAGNRVIEYTYDAANRLFEQVTDPNGVILTSSIQYNAFGEQFRITDAGGRVTELRYDVSGQLVERITDPDVGGLQLSTTFEYDARGRQAAIVSAVGNRTEFSYNEFGQLTNKVVDPLGLNISTAYAYDDNGNMTKRTDPLDAETFYVFDDANRLKYTLEEVEPGLGHVTETVYDDLDRIVATHRYADKFALPVGGAAPVINVGASAYESLWNVYDDAGRLVFTINEENYVTGYVYDDNGLLLQNNQYAAPIASPGTATAASLQAALPAATATANISYDELGRERTLTEADGSVNEFYYDLSGNLIQSVLPDTVSSSRFFYDAAGRKRYELDALGNLVRLIQDDSGNLVLRQVFANSSFPSLDTATDAESVTGLIETQLNFAVDNGKAAAQRSEYLVYDAAGRLSFSIDGLGYITEQVYDADGRVIETLQHTSSMPAATVTTTIADIETHLATPAPTSPPRSTHFVYDADGRLRFTVDGLDRLTEQEYDDAGNLLRQVRYAEPYASPNLSEVNVEAFADLQPGTALRETVFQYDSLGRTTTMTNALGQSESYEYDAYGNRSALINKAGNRWEYQYDGVGNLVEERTPLETFYRTDISNPQSPVVTLHSGYQITSMEYDYRGNVSKITEGVIRSAALVDDETQKYETTFSYDVLGRQTGISYVVGEGAGTPVSVTTRYDAFGNAIANSDARGNLSYKVYDTLGRQRFDIDAEGYVTENEYDATGNLVRLVRYAAQQTQLLGTIDTVHTEAALETLTGTIGLATDRTLTHEYDAAGQRTRTMSLSVDTFDSASATQYSSAPETTYAYNSYGELWLEQRKISEVGGSPAWAETYRFYNGVGQLTAEVNAGGYATETTYNGYGEVSSTTEFARTIADPVGLAAANKDNELNSGLLPLASDGTDGAIGADRVREFEYDALGRVTREYMLEVAYSTYDGATFGNGMSDPRMLLLSTEYDAVGNIARLTDTEGNTLETGFNSLGHAIWTKEAARKVLLDVEAGVANGIDYNVSFDDPATNFVTRSPLTTYQYDVFGNVLVEHAYANGIAEGADPGVPANVVADAQHDKLTYYRYDTSRRKTEELDAEGNSTEFVYDVAGNIIEETRDYRGAKGASDTLYTSETHYAYDALGRQITTEVHLGSANQMTHESIGNQMIEVAYNAFGEVTSRGTNRAAFEETFTYDNAGRLIQGPNGNGIQVAYEYDLLGNLTREQSATNGESVYHYDALGRGTRVDRPIVLQNYDDSAGVYTGGSTTLEYDRWDNVVGQSERSIQWADTTAAPTEVLENRYEFNYNKFDQVVLERRPEANVVGEDGSEVIRAVEVQRFYDRLGRQVAERDARHTIEQPVVRYKIYNNANQLAEEVDALGNSTHYAYDAFGRQVAKQNALNYITTTQYNRLDQAVLIGDIRYDNSNTDSYNQQLIAHTYNALGYQVSTTYGQSIDAGVVTTATTWTDYDVRGNVVRTETAEGVITTSGYDSQGNKAFQRTGLYGTWVGNYHELSWTYDYFGRVQSYDNLNADTFSYHYDDVTGLLDFKGPSGQLSTFLNNPANLTGGTTYEYYDNGALKRLHDRATGLVAEYEYDSAGRRTYEYANGSDALGAIYEQTTRTEYDEHGRIYRVVTTDLLQAGGLDTMEAVYGYDEAGNRRYVKVSSQYSSTYAPPVNNAPTVNGVTLSPVPTVQEQGSLRHLLGTNLFSDADGDDLTYFADVQVFSEHVSSNGTVTRYTYRSDPLPDWVSLDVVKGATDQIYIDIQSPPLIAAQHTANSASGAAGEYTVQLHARDKYGAEAIRTFNFNISDLYVPNDPPVLGTPIPDLFRSQGQDVNYTIPATAFSDPDGNSLIYDAVIVVWELVDVTPDPEDPPPGPPPITPPLPEEPQVELQLVEKALPSWLLFDEETGTFSGSLSGISSDATFLLRIRAKEIDTGELYLSEFQAVTLTILAQPNAAPTVGTALSNATVAEDATLNYPIPAGAFTDPDGDTLTYTATVDGVDTDALGWAGISGSTLNFTPGFSDAGSYTVVVTADDSLGGTVSSSFTLTVTDVNRAPTTGTALSNASVDENATLNYAIPASTFNDLDGDTLTYTATVGGVETTSLDWANLAGDTLNFTPGFSDSGSYSVVVTADDGMGGTVDSSFTLTVNNVNRAPTAGTSLPVDSVDEGQTLNYPIPASAFNDLDGDALSYTATVNGVAYSSLSWVNITGSTLEFSPGFSRAGTYTVVVTADDGFGGTADSSFVLTVNDINRAPIVTSAIPNQSVIVGDTNWSFPIPAGTFTDLDGDSITLTVTSKPAWMSYTAGTNTLSGTPPSATTWNVTVRASDGSLTVTDTFSVTATTTNAPVLTNPPLSSYNAVVGTAFNLDLPNTVFVDPDGDAITYTASGMPAWMSFNASTVQFTGMPQAGSSLITLTATDIYGASSSTTFTVGANTAPQLDTPITTVAPQVTRAFSYDIGSHFSDPDGDALTFIAIQEVMVYEPEIGEWFPSFAALPAWMAMSSSGMLTGTAPSGEVGNTYTIRVVANDGALARASVFSFSPIQYVNQAPVAGTAMSPQSVNESGTLNFAIPASAFSDPDNHALTYSATVGGVSTNSLGWVSLSGSTINFNPGYSQSGSYTVTVTAHDPYGATVSSSFTLTVNNVNRQPVVNAAIPNQSGISGVAWSYVIPSNTFTDPDGTTPTITITSKPAWMSYNSGSRTLSGTPPSAGSFNITVRASDGSLNVSDTFTLTTTSNNAPVLNSPPASSYTATVGISYNLDLPYTVFTDPNGDAITYTASGLPGWMSFNPATVQFTGTPQAAHAGSTTITLTATDSYGASSSTTFTMNVNTSPQLDSSILSQSYQAMRPFSYNVGAHFSDADGDTLTFTAWQQVNEYEPELGIWIVTYQPLPAWMSLTPAGVLSGTPTAPAVGGTHRIFVYANDGLRTTYTVFDLSVVAYVNVAPTAGAGSLANQSVNEAASINYTFPSNAFSDPDGDALTYTATVGGVATTSLGWASISGRTLTFNPGYSQAGTYTVAVKARDPYGATYTRNFTLTVNNTNRLPTVANAIPNQDASVNAAWSYVVPSNTFTDLDGDTLTYTATSLPSWMSFNAATRTLSGTPTSASTWNVTIRASDGSGNVSDTFSVTATTAPVNQAPVFTPGMYSTIFNSGQFISINFANMVTDPDGDTLTFSANNLPSGLSINSSTGYVSGTLFGSIERYFVVVASDGEFNAFKFVNLMPSGGGGGFPLMMSLMASAPPLAEPVTMEMSMVIPPPASSMMMTYTNPYDMAWNFDDVHEPYWMNQGQFTHQNNKEYWYTYDLENRITISEGVLNGVANKIGINTTQGQIVDYDAVGNQILRVEATGANSYKAEAFHYNDLGQLIKSQTNKGSASSIDWAAAATRATAYSTASYWQDATEFRYDLAGRVVAQVDYFLEGEMRTVLVENPLDGPPVRTPADVGGSVKSATTTEYDNDGRVTKVKNFGIADNFWTRLGTFNFWIQGGGNTLGATVAEGDLSLISEVLYDANAYDASGKLIRYVYHKILNVDEGSDPIRDEYTTSYFHSYKFIDSYQTYIVSGNGSHPDQKRSVSTSNYDDSGRLISVEEKFVIPGFTEENHRYFRHNGDGQIIYKVGGVYDTDPDGNPQTNDASFTPESDGSDQRNFYFSGGNQLGSVDGQGRIFFEDQAAYQVVKGGDARSAQTFTARDGDTLRSIARLVYGSETLWYIIADANGLSDDTAELLEGQNLRIPAFSSSVNDADSFKAYNAEEVIGDRTPAVPYVPPPPSADKGCGFIGQIIMIVVAIVVSYYVGPEAGSFFANLAGGTATATTAAAGAFVTGVAASTASQLVGKALGVVDHFSLKSALAGGLTAAAGSFLGGANALGNNSKAAEVLGEFGVRAARGAATYLSSQAAQIIVGGQRSSFSWSSVAAAGLGSAIGQSFADKLHLNGEDPLSQFANGLVSGVSAAATSRAFGVGGQIELEAIAIDAFANAIGNSITGHYEAKKRGEVIAERSEAIASALSDDLTREVEGLAPTVFAADESLATRAEQGGNGIGNTADETARLSDTNLDIARSSDEVNETIAAITAPLVAEADTAAANERLIDDFAYTTAGQEIQEWFAEQVRWGIEDALYESEGFSFKLPFNPLNPFDALQSGLESPRVLRRVFALTQAAIA